MTTYAEPEKLSTSRRRNNKSEFTQSASRAPEDFMTIYKKADEKTRGRFRAKKSWLMRNHNCSEQEAISKALHVFDKATNIEVKPVVSKYEPSNEEVEQLVQELQSLQNSAKIINHPTRGRTEDAKPSKTMKPILNKFTILKFSLYLLIVPITAQTIQAALSRADLSEWFLVAISWVLAIITDYIALEHFLERRDHFTVMKTYST